MSVYHLPHQLQQGRLRSNKDDTSCHAAGERAEGGRLLTQIESLREFLIKVNPSLAMRDECDGLSDRKQIAFLRENTQKSGNTLFVKLKSAEFA
jgi:hypothetical protein